MESKNSYANVLKGIGIIAVVLGHVNVPNWTSKIIYAFHMPLFFAIYGYLYDSKKWEGNFFGLVKKRAKTYIIPYFLFGSIIVGLNVVENRLIDRRPDWLQLLYKNIYGLLYCIPRAEDMTNFVPMWYLPCVFIAAIIFWILTSSKFFKNNFIWQVVVTCVMISGNCIWIGRDIQQLPWLIDSVLFVIPYMYLGRILKDRRETFSNAFMFLALIIGCIFSVINTFWVHYADNRYGCILFAAISGVLLVIFTFEIGKKMCKSRILQFYGRNSIVIVIANYYVDHVICRIAMTVGIDYYSLNWEVKFILTMAILTMIIFIKERWQSRTLARAQ